MSVDAVEGSGLFRDLVHLPIRGPERFSLVAPVVLIHCRDAFVAAHVYDGRGSHSATRSQRPSRTNTMPERMWSRKVPGAQGDRRTGLVSDLRCTWVASGLVYGLRVAPGPTRLVAAILGVSGIAEMLNAATKAPSWSGQAARKQSGS